MTDLSDKVQPIIRDGNIINLRLDLADKYTLYFRYFLLLLLLGSLISLANNFYVFNKGLFPFKLQK